MRYFFRLTLAIFFGVLCASILLLPIIGLAFGAEAKPSPTPAAGETPGPPAGKLDEPEAVLDTASLIDYFICLGAGIWLCLGAVALVSIPLIFLALHAWGKRRLEGKA